MYFAKGFKSFKVLFNTVGKGFAVAWAKEYGISKAQLEIGEFIVTKVVNKNV